MTHMRAVALPAPAPAFQQNRFHAITLAVAFVAAVTTYGTIHVMLPATAMFLGWIAYSVSGQTVREGVANLTSFLLGIGLGIVSGIVIQLLTPLLGVAATPVTIFGAVVLVLSLRGLKPINNPLAYFLGLTSFFASGFMPSIATFAILATAGAIGALAAFAANVLQARLQHVGVD